MIHRDTLAVLDADGDGRQEIAHCWVSGGRKQLVLRSGRTGAVLHAVNLDASSGTECQIAGFRVSGRSKPIILVAEINKSGCAKAGNYIDTWARTVAFDTNLTRLWDRNTCAAGHYAYPVDGNGDGLAGSSSSAAISTARPVTGSARSTSAARCQFGGGGRSRPRATGLEAG